MRIKVGFSSMYFRDHASGKMIQGIIEALPKDKFDIIVFAIKEFNDYKPYHGVVADRIRAAASTYVELNKAWGLPEMRRIIADFKLDVLVYAEIGMDPANYLLAYARLAPVQVVTHGHASTTGIPNLDYFVSYKPFEIPEAQQYYSEKLVTFSDFSPYYKPSLPEQIAEKEELWAHLGLTPIITPSTTVYLCHQTLFKLTPDFDLVFKAVLLNDTNGILLLKEFRTPELNRIVLQRFLETLKEVMDRIYILPGHQVNDDKWWYGLLRHSDVILDSYPFGGYTTTLEAFAAGSVPIVTLPHPMMPGRCTYGFYRIMGIDDCIASSIDDYVQLAVKLGRDRTLRAKVSHRIESRAPLLYNRMASIPEWTQFLSEAANHQPISQLHLHSPTAPIPEPRGTPLPRLS